MEINKMLDLNEKFEKLFKIYDSKIEITGILAFTIIIVIGLFVVFIDNREVKVGDNIYYKQIIPKTYRDSFIIFTIIYLFGLYGYGKKKTNTKPEADEILCPECKIPMKKYSWKCKKCGKYFTP